MIDVLLIYGSYINWTMHAINCIGKLGKSGQLAFIEEYANASFSDYTGQQKKILTAWTLLFEVYAPESEKNINMFGLH